VAVPFRPLIPHPSTFNSALSSLGPRPLLRCAGHSATAGAAVGALATYFGNGTLTFTIGTASTEYFGLAPRTYTSLSEVRRHRAVPGWRR
jgi:hypothetical protein